MSLVVARALEVGYGGRMVASIGELAIAAGDRLAVTGGNGSGKTTLLKTLGGLIPPVAGTLTTPAPGPGGAVYVHPSPFLFAGTGAANVLIGAHGDHEAARKALEALRATSFSASDVRRLSHGQRQRIALARAIAAGPSLLLVDEPETGLDEEGIAAWRDFAAAWTGAIVTATPEVRRQNTEYRMVRLATAGTSN